MIPESLARVICISLNKARALNVKLIRDTSDESRIVWKENLRAKHSALSTADVNTSNRYVKLSSFEDPDKVWCVR